MKRQNKPQPKTHYKPLNIHQIYPIKTLNKIGSTPLIINKELLNETYFDLTYSRRFEAQKKNYTNLYNKKVDPNANSNKVDKNKKVVLAKTKKESQILKNKDYATQKQQAFKSLTLFSEIMKKSQTQSSQKQKRHYPINPNPESYRFFTETNNEKKQTYLVSPSRHRKLLYDFEDKIDFNNTSDSRRGSISLKDLKSTGKKTSYILNMFKESYDLGMDSKITMRKPNKNRTRSSFNFA